MIAVLFVRKRSIYKEMPCVDAWDIDRDARGYVGNDPVVAHPPCRAWGQLSHMAKPRDDEKALALFAVDTVRRCGGVLEHPKNSKLWPVAGLPEPGQVDSFGGWTMPINQNWFGHRAEKATRLYIVGCAPGAAPDFPMVLGKPSGLVEMMGQAEREHTPRELAEWLFNLASRCRRA